MNCVVSRKERVRAVSYLDVSFEQPLRQQLEQIRQHYNAWLQYLFANYYFVDKNDIIDSNKIDHTLTQYSHEYRNSNICSEGCPILTQPQPHCNILSIGLLLAHEASLFHESSASHLNTALLIAGPDQICFDDQASIWESDSYSGSDKELKHIPISNIERLENKKALSIRPQYSLPTTLSYTLLLFVLIGSKNALSCTGFSSPMRFDNFGVIGYNNPNQSPTSPFPRVPFLHNRQRSLNLKTDDPLETLPTFMDSFTKEQTSLPQSSNAPTLSSWTSLLTNPFKGDSDTLDAHIKRILVPRVSGTSGNIQVRNYIINVLKSNDYTVELDEFTDSTPIGKVKFANIIASSNPKACRQLVLACHYDSKMMAGFLGATDSAVPCAMLLKLSETFNKSFRSSESEELDETKDSLGLRFIFFDGEEAFEKWSQTDSLYGSRHLAQKWSLQSALSQCPGKNELSRIELFVLLDLIGTSDTTFVMYNRQLKHHYDAMQNYEKSYLSRNGLAAGQIRRETAFKGRYIPLDFVEDDHVPFKQRGVPILSLLASPFPSVWHTINDNYSAIDHPRTRRILYVLEEFVANYKKEPNP